jgi:hypothetical protein
MIGNFIRYLMLSLVLPLGAFAAASSYAQDYPSLRAGPARKLTGRTIRNARRRNF